MKRIKSFDNSHKLLYLIATPIGNLGEFSSRALDVIREMDIIAADFKATWKKTRYVYQDINQNLSVRHGMSQYRKQTFAHFVSCLLCEIRIIL